MKKAILIALTVLFLVVACEQQGVTVTQTTPETVQSTTPAVIENPITAELEVEDEYADLQTAQDAFNALDEALELYE